MTEKFEIEYFRKMTPEDLFDEIQDLVSGDGYDGMMSSNHFYNYRLAKKVFGEKMRMNNIPWSE